MQIRVEAVGNICRINDIIFIFMIYVLALIVLFMLSIDASKTLILSIDAPVRG